MPLECLECLNLEGDRFVWVALDPVTVEEVQVTGRSLGFDPLSLDWSGCLAPKLFDRGESIVVVFRAIATAGSGIENRNLVIYVGPRFVVSAMNGGTDYWRAVRQQIEATPELLRRGPSYLLYILLSQGVGRYSHALSDFIDRVQALENRAIAAPLGFDDLRLVLSLRHEGVELERGLSLNRAVTEALRQRATAPIYETIRPYLGDVLNRLGRSQSRVRAAQQSIAMLDNMGAIPSAETNRIVRKLTAWALMLGLLTAFTALYSMYFPSIPGMSSRFGYPVFLMCVGGLGLSIYGWFHRRQWL